MSAQWREVFAAIMIKAAAKELAGLGTVLRVGFESVQFQMRLSVHYPKQPDDRTG